MTEEPNSTARNSPNKETQSKPEDEAKTRRFFFLEAPLKAGIGLNSALGMDEGTYRSVAGYALQDCRSYYLYGVIDEVVKTTVSMRRWIDFLSDTETKQDKTQDKHLARVIIESIVDEQRLWTRKLSELLCNLILFESTNDQDHFQLFLLCQELDAYLRLQGDFGEFFACQNGNANHHIQFLIERIETLGRKTDLAQAWFLKKPIGKKKVPNTGHVFVSVRKRFQLALMRATPDQRIAIGVSYEKTYGTSSRSIHPSIGGPPQETELKDVDTGIGHVSLLCSHIILIGYKLLGKETDGFAKIMEGSLSDESDAPQMLKSRYSKELDVGDVVFAYGPDPCQVLEKSQSRYGYTSYKVRYLAQPLLPELPEDWFPAPFVHLVWPYKNIRRDLTEIYSRHGIGEDIINKIRIMPDEELNSHIAKTVKELHREGVLEQMMHNQSKGCSR